MMMVKYLIFPKNQESSEAENCTKYSYCTEDLNCSYNGGGFGQNMRVQSEKYFWKSFPQEPCTDCKINMQASIFM